MIVLSIHNHPLLQLLHYGKTKQPQVLGAIANSILNTIFDLAPPYLIGIAIDVVANQENSLIAQLGITSITGQLAILSGFAEWEYDVLRHRHIAKLEGVKSQPNGVFQHFYGLGVAEGLAMQSSQIVTQPSIFSRHTGHIRLADHLSPSGMNPGYTDQPPVT